MDFSALVEQCAPSVHPATMAAIARVESGRNPLAIGINGPVRITRQPLTKQEAVDTANQLLQMSVSIDLGLAQINSANLKPLGLTVEQAFEPCANLRAAETVLRWCYDTAARRLGVGQPALQAALSCFNTGGPARGLTNGYVQGIYRAAKEAP
jgi:type IV secretion system protein VirB1